MRVPRTLLRVLAAGAGAVATLVPAFAAHADPTPGQVAGQIQQAADELEDVVESYNGISENLKTTQAAATDATARLTELQSQLDAAYGDVHVLVNAAYRGGGQLSTVATLLNAGSGAGLADQITTMRYVHRAQQRDITRYAEVKTKLDADRKHYADLLAQQTSQQRQLADRRDTIESNIRDLEALKRRLNVPPPVKIKNPVPAAPAVAGSAGAAVSFAYAQINKPYQWGAAGPGAYDCSGLTMAAWQHAGVKLPHNAAQQWSAVTKVGRGSLQPGDLVFYRSLGHVAIYVGGNNVIHAPHAGADVTLASVDMMAPYGYGRPG